MAATPWTRAATVKSRLEGMGESFVLGIQFHPERPGEVPEMVGVFDALVTRDRIAC